MKEKEYLIAYQWRGLFSDSNWKWGKVVKRCKMTGAKLNTIEDEIRDRIGADLVRIMTFSELESDSEGV